MTSPTMNQSKLKLKLKEMSRPRLKVPDTAQSIPKQVPEAQ